MPFDLSDYVDVPARLAWFFDKYPEGSLQSDILERGEDFVVVKAVAYRSAEDNRPGTGMASEPVPGRTPYTKDSEVMNAETSAWGRALAAIGAPTRGTIASAEEVSNAIARRNRNEASAGEGEAPTDQAGPGEPSLQTANSPGPATKTYPLSPDQCDHKFKNGRWMPTNNVDGVPRCPRCGESALIYRESA